MRESSFDIAARLRSEAEALEELFLGGEGGQSYQARVEEETRLEDLLNLAQDRLAAIRLEALQEALDDVEAIVRGLREDETNRKDDGRPLTLIQSFIKIAEAERVRLHHIIDAAVRAEEDSRRLRDRSRGFSSGERYYSQERGGNRREATQREATRRDRDVQAQAQARARKTPVREVVDELTDIDSA
jgi:hypothetical protein